MSEYSETPEDITTGRSADTSVSVPDPVIDQSLPHEWGQALRDALANFDRYAIQHLRDLVHRAGSSRSEKGQPHNRQDSEASSGFE